MGHDARAAARYMRQKRLAEIGERGQERLEAAEVFVPEELGRVYLRAAGVKVRDAGERLEVSAETLGLRNAEAAHVAAGAWSALVAMRAILGVG